MLFNNKHFDKFDASEDCLVAKILLGLIFNKYVEANKEWKLARGFLQCYLEDDMKMLDFSEAEILIKPKFSWFSKDSHQFQDRTAPDVLLHFPNQAVIAIEAKYTLPIQQSTPTHMPHQLLRELQHLSTLQDMFGAEKKYLFLLMTHQRLFVHLMGGGNDIGIKILRKCIENYGDDFRINTWNCVYNIIKIINDGLLLGKNEILEFFDQKQNYMTNSLNGQKKGLVSLLSHENNEIPLYQWSEIKKMVQEPIPKPDGILIKPKTLGKQNSNPPSGKYEKPRWRQCESYTECFDLCAENPNKIDVEKIRRLFQSVLDSSSGFGQEYRRNAKEKFFRWINNPVENLSEEAYACLSNWFLTDNLAARSGERANAALDLWHELFHTVPERRLTSPKSGHNHKVLAHEFRMWWNKEKSED